MSDRDELKARAELGARIEAFKQSDIWTYLAQRASEDIIEALEGLKDCDPEQPSIIRRLQNRAKLAEHFLNWLDEAIQDGKSADEQLELLDVVD